MTIKERNALFADPVNSPNVVKVEPADQSAFNNGEFEGWGTSFCWWANRIGYSDEMCKQAADLFYREETGLGLNIVRYNIGGGDNPSHNHIVRSDSEIPGYLYWNENTKSYEYDWTADGNQRNALFKAIEVCGDKVQIEAFANSAPYFMTKSGCTSGSVTGIDDNIKEDCYDDFAEYLAEVIKHYKTDYGITFTSVSAMNEPTSNWPAYSDKQEGCHVSPGESQSKLLLEVEKAFIKHGITHVLITASDDTDVDSQRTSFEQLTAAAKKAVDRIDTHTYVATDHARIELRKLAEENNVGLWMSETDSGSALGTSSGEMGPALWLAQQIVSDMNHLKPSAWVIWQTIANYFSEDGYKGKKDSKTDVPSDNEDKYWGVAVADIDHNEILLTQKYYAFGQFTRFIRPGYTIISCDDAKSMAAYDKKSKTLVIVTVNVNPSDLKYSFDLSDFISYGSSVQVVRTSGNIESGESWAEQNPLAILETGFEADLKGYSITTFIINDVVYKK